MRRYWCCVSCCCCRKQSGDKRTLTGDVDVHVELEDEPKTNGIGKTLPRLDVVLCVAFVCVNPDWRYGNENLTCEMVLETEDFGSGSGVGIRAVNVSVFMSVFARMHSRNNLNSLYVGFARDFASSCSSVVSSCSRCPPPGSCSRPSDPP